MTSAIDGGPGWHIDPATLLPVLDDEATFRAANADDQTLDVLVALWSGDPDHAATLLKPLVDADPVSWHLQALSAVRRALDLRTAAEADASLVASSRRALDRALDLVSWPFAHTRAWGWGIAFLYDPIDGEIPDVDGAAPVTIDPLGLGLGVRHAADYDWQADAEGPAGVTIRLDQPQPFALPERSVVVDAVLETPSGSLSCGDAEDEILLPVPGPRTRIVISHHDDEWNQPDEVWIDLYAAD